MRARGWYSSDTVQCARGYGTPRALGCARAVGYARVARACARDGGCGSDMRYGTARSANIRSAPFTSVKFALIPFYAASVPAEIVTIPAAHGQYVTPPDRLPYRQYRIQLRTRLPGGGYVVRTYAGYRTAHVELIVPECRLRVKFANSIANQIKSANNNTKFQI